MGGYIQSPSSDVDPGPTHPTRKGLLENLFLRGAARGSTFLRESEV